MENVVCCVAGARDAYEGDRLQREFNSLPRATEEVGGVKDHSPGETILRYLDDVAVCSTVEVP